VSRDHSDKAADGLYNICYINAFQTQPDAESFWKSEYSSSQYVSPADLIG